MHKTYLQGHLADSVLGRVGTTIDWPKSIPDGIPADWGNYVNHPPRGADWREFLKAGQQIFARNAVRPFNLYYEPTCNLIFLSEDLFQSVDDWSDTLDDIGTCEIAFGKRRKITARFARLKFGEVLQSPPLSPQSRFDRYNASKRHMHGTLVMRGEETNDQLPAPQATDLSFADYDAYFGSRRARNDFSTKMFPTHLDLRTDKSPLMFSTPLDFYVREEIIPLILDAPTPGIGFPFPPMTVDFRN